MQPPDRTVSVHMTATGRLGQSTMFLPSTSMIDSEATDAHPVSRPALGGTAQEDIADDAGWNEQFSESNGDDRELHNESDHSHLAEWVTHCRAAYLDEMIRHDGRAGIETCAKCGGEGLYKCKDCFGCQLWCHACFVERHSHAPLHRALVSNHLQQITLSDAAIALDWRPL